MQPAAMINIKSGIRTLGLSIFSVRVGSISTAVDFFLVMLDEFLLSSALVLPQLSLLDFLLSRCQFSFFFSRYFSAAGMIHSFLTTGSFLTFFLASSSFFLSYCSSTSLRSSSSLFFLLAIKSLFLFFSSKSSFLGENRMNRLSFEFCLFYYSAYWSMSLLLSRIRWCEMTGAQKSSSFLGLGFLISRMSRYSPCWLRSTQSSSQAENQSLKSIVIAKAPLSVMLYSLMYWLASTMYSPTSFALVESMLKTILSAKS